MNATPQGAAHLHTRGHPQHLTAPAHPSGPGPQWDHLEVPGRAAGEGAGGLGMEGGGRGQLGWLRGRRGAGGPCGSVALRLVALGLGLEGAGRLLVGAAHAGGLWPGKNRRPCVLGRSLCTSWSPQLLLLSLRMQLTSGGSLFLTMSYPLLSVQCCAYLLPLEALAAYLSSSLSC